MQSPQLKIRKICLHSKENDCKFAQQNYALNQLKISKVNLEYTVGTCHISHLNFWKFIWYNLFRKYFANKLHFLLYPL